MTDILNFFQSMQSFKIFAGSRTTVQECKLAVWLKREAENLALAADEEMRNGTTAQNLAQSGLEKNTAFAEIAAWHFACAAEKYQKSSQRFAEAAQIETGKQGEFQRNAKEMVRRERLAVEVSGKFLN